jgi:predicted nucleotidyltransferase
MTDRTQYLLELVKRNVKAYISNPKTKAAMVAGSVAEGLCDEYSDCDVMLYYDELPSEEELHLARQQNQGAELIEILGDRQEGAFGESFFVNGVECQFAHATIAQWEKEMSTVLEEFDVPSPIMKMLYGTLVGIPLYGEALIQQWKAKVANYPDKLAQTMVEKHLRFFAVWGMQEKLVQRDATLWYYQIMVEAAQNLLGVLSGLNHLYYSTFQFKRMSKFIEQMEIAPKNLAARLESLFHHEPHIAVHQLEALVRDTVELVQIHMPQVDTSSAKQKLGWSQQPWTLSEADR